MPHYKPVQGLKTYWVAKKKAGFAVELRVNISMCDAYPDFLSHSRRLRRLISSFGNSFLSLGMVGKKSAGEKPPFFYLPPSISFECACRL
ncbi:hypothetical protein CDAR_222431 [Caerostris darwini]|uniref:Uncharacterized protein n=1 Tax=Caerostris darwini TaxID=1538125 RepID=A0AAV4SW05_9ARAC|nr:hypothetical protein CDAR_222431 [Caerostris darwini]